MKYKTFVGLRTALIGLLALGGIAGLFYGCQQSAPPVAQAPVAQAPVAQVPATAPEPAIAAPAPAQAANPGDTGAFTDVHREILRLQKEPLTNGKDAGDSIKWVFKDAGITAEFRSDKNKGSTTWNRVKVDYNGNKKYEERWDFKEGSVKRRVAPNDDEKYSEEYSLQGETWQKK